MADRNRPTPPGEDHFGRDDLVEYVTELEEYIDGVTAERDALLKAARMRIQAVNAERGFSQIDPADFAELKSDADKQLRAAIAKAEGRG